MTWVQKWAFTLAGCLLCACGQTASVSQPSIPQIKIGVSLYSQEDTFISYLRNALEEAAKEREIRDNVKISLNIMDGKFNQSIQNDQVDKFIAQDYHVLCINEVDRTNASVLIDKAKAADIPVIFFNREPVANDLNRWDKVYYVGSDAAQAGQMQGTIVADLYRKDPSIDLDRDGRLQYIMLEGEPGHQDAAIRTEYSIKTVKSRGIPVEKLASDSANWQRAQAYTKMSSWLADPALAQQVEVVFCNNDDMALGVIDAYTEAEITDLPVIVGVDGTPPALQAMAEGKLAGTVYNDGEGQARAIFELAYALATQGDVHTLDIPLEGKYVWMPHLIRTPES